MINLEVFGIYQPPSRPLTTSQNLKRIVPYALKALQSAHSADFHIVCEDGRAIPCSRRILEERWEWFREQWRQAGQRAQQVVEDMSCLAASPAAENGAATGSAGASGSSINARGATIVKASDLPPDQHIPNSLQSAFEKWKASYTISPQTLVLSEPYPVVKALLEYFYTCDLVTPLQHRPPILSALLILAAQFHLSDLKSKVVYAMHSKLNEQNCLGIYEIASLCGCEKLQVRALRLVLTMQKRQSKTQRYAGRDDGARGQGGVGRSPPSGGGGRSTMGGSGPASTSVSANGHSRTATASGMTGGASAGPYATSSSAAAPPSAYHRSYSKSPSIRAGSPRSPPVHAKEQPVASMIPPSTSDNIFTFPPTLTASTPGQSRLVAHVSPDIKSMSTPDLSSLVVSPPGLDDFAMPTASTSSTNSTTGLAADMVELSYDPPTYKARPRTSSLKSIHHYQNNLQRQPRSEKMSHKKHPSVHNVEGAHVHKSEKENARPRSRTITAGVRHRLANSKSISSMFSGPPSATSSLGWLGEHLSSRPNSQTPTDRPTSSTVKTKPSGPFSQTLKEMASSMVRTTRHDGVMTSPSSPLRSNFTATESAPGSGQSLESQWSGEQSMFWQPVHPSTMATPAKASQNIAQQTIRQRLRSLDDQDQGDSVDKTPIAKRPLQIDTRLAQAGYTQIKPHHHERNPSFVLSPGSDHSPRGEMPLFYVPPSTESMA